MNTTIQVRIDKRTKERAQKSLRGMGLDLSSGIKYFLSQISESNNLFWVCDFGYTHSYTPQKLAQYNQERKKALKSGKFYRATKELMADILK